MTSASRYAVSLQTLLAAQVSADQLVQEQPSAAPLTNPALWGGALDSPYTDGAGGGGCDGGGCD